MLDKKQIQDLLEAVAAGRLGVADAVDRLRALDVLDLGFARLDTGREHRTGTAEAIFAPGKSDEHLAAIVENCLDARGKVLVTRLEKDRAAPLLERFEVLHYHETARVLEARPESEASGPPVAVVSAGTSDLPVAEEAAVVLEHLEHPVERVNDVGVAGIHRLFSCLERLRAARALVVVAGMEGALPSVVAGLVASPVVAVPTSVGYGASFGGVAALLGMLNSCAEGVGVVNIDNGFGAATLVHRIVRADGDGADS
jgi:NCAIR mutase (PurE)-related protein